MLRFGKAPVRKALTALSIFAGALPVYAADDNEGYGHAYPGEIGLQQAVSPIAHEIHFLHNGILLPIIIAICLLVLALIVYVILKFNEKAHPEPSRTTHNTLIEVIWAVVPVMILVVIAIPSFRLLTRQLVLPKADVTLKAQGNQWYWTYTFPPDQGGGFSFDSRLKEDADLHPEKGDIRLLSVDNEVYVPVNKTIRVQVTADPGGVIHSFVIQAFGVRMDAVPGRMNEVWFKAEREGIYYGQCSKLCGEDHAYMPIAFRVVSEPAYEAWLKDSKKKFASADERRVAAADAPKRLDVSAR